MWDQLQCNDEEQAMDLAQAQARIQDVFLCVPACARAAVCSRGPPFPAHVTFVLGRSGPIACSLVASRMGVLGQLHRARARACLRVCT